jgi:hypothetical protein
MRDRRRKPLSAHGKTFMTLTSCIARRANPRRLILALAAAVAACGGGGSGGGSTDPAANVTVSGVAEFESVPNNLATGALDFAARTWRPIRGATIELIGPAGTTLASSATNSRGEYSFTLANPNADVFVRVRAQALRGGASGGAWDVSVRDNTSAEALYTLDTAAFTPAATQTRGVRAASGWGGSGYTAARAAAPFAVLDNAWSAMQTVLGVAPNQTFPPLRIFWSINNRPVESNNLGSGDIGTSFYVLNNGQHQLYLLGAANTDTDEYDRSVVVHEFGHYLQSALSRNDSPGGPHSGDELLDRRVAFSEGWGNAWAGIVAGEPRYADSLGPQQGSGFIIDVSSPPASNRGWYSEDSVQYLLWRFHETAGIGLAPIYSVLTGPLRTSSVPASMHSFAALLKANVPAAAASIDSLLQGQLITVNDALGSGESNNGGVAAALPMYSTYNGGSMRVCVNDNIGRPNKVGNYVYVRFTTATVLRTISVAVADGATGTDPDVELFRADGSSTSAVGVTPGNETFVDALPAGTHTLAISDFNMQSSTTAVGQRCFNLSVQ